MTDQCGQKGSDGGGGGGGWDGVCRTASGLRTISFTTVG